MNSTRNKEISANYRVNEPISNFKIRVKIVQEKPLLAELLENEGDTRDTNFLEEEDRTFSWQEKVFSTFEVSFYSNESNCIAEYQKEYHVCIKEKNIQGSEMYSYTESDSYYLNGCLLTNNKRYKTKLSNRNQFALPVLQNRKPFTERYNKTVIDNQPNEMRIRSNHYVYADRLTMYVMVDLSRKDKTIAGSNDDLETVLCTVAYDKAHKILTINPDFTTDKPYTIVNSSGVKFNYWIEHASEKQSSLELQQHQDNSRREIKERLVHRQGEIFHGLQLASPNVQKIFIKLDIISAHQFFYNGLFVTYYVNLPEHWSTNDEESMFGRTQRCNLQNNSAYFSYATDISLDHHLGNKLNEKKTCPCWPQILISVASFDAWKRYRTEGYAAVPLPFLPGSYEFNVPTWRPAGSIINSLRRFFTGGTYELEDVTYSGVPAGSEGNFLNKSHLKVASSGYVKINMNIVHLNHPSIGNSFQSDYIEKLSADALMNNIENIFEQFKAARERMIQVRNSICKDQSPVF